ncbi:MAG: methylated-DNA--[protein]-cysteine S-methyltransferase [Gammaproteobacteria bacterium]|nr:methylated-DNA--[protein]-cysteine S-methyltransferase [Gammaproteobacteria bacterium]
MKRDTQQKTLLRVFEAVVPLPVGAWQVGIRTDGRVVIEIDFIEAQNIELVCPSVAATEAAQQIQRYLDNSQWRFTIALKLNGTPFQQRVWAALQKIAPGETCSYGALARDLSSAARAVGGACRANPIAIMVPCHRVVAAQSLGGFSGATSGSELLLKQWLLKHESYNNKN